jgi:IS5 family transposase
MTKFTQVLGAAAVAAVLGLTSFTTASAAPVVPAPIQLTTDAQQVQYRDRDGRPRWMKRAERRHDRRVERRIERRGYWRGHRGYREARRGYRRHTDGYYYAPEVFRLVIR